MLTNLFFANCSIYESLNSVFQTQPENKTFLYTLQLIILFGSLFIGIVGSKRKITSSALIILFILIISDLNLIIDNLKELIADLNVTNTFLEKIDLILSADITFKILSTIITSFIISYLTLQIVDITLFSIYCLISYSILKSSIEDFLMENFNEQISLTLKIVIYVIVFIGTYFLYKMSMSLFYSLFFSFVGSVGCMWSISMFFDYNFGYTEFFRTGDLFKIDNYAFILNLIIIGIFCYCQLSTRK
ncbi:hypothetical protein DMUE_5750 [Dictyocoela muelleri]|nr:hypothetical protein DMUE_5750 [Dictyocoela muelleri]